MSFKLNNPKIKLGITLYFIMFFCSNLTFADNDTENETDKNFFDQKISEIKSINSKDSGIEPTYKIISLYKNKKYEQCTDQALSALSTNSIDNAFNSFEFMYGTKCLLRLASKNKLKNDIVKRWAKVYFEFNTAEITKPFHAQEMDLYLSYLLKLSEVLFDNLKLLDLDSEQIGILTDNLKKSKKNKIKSELFLFFLNRNDQETAKNYLLHTDPKLTNINTLKVLNDYFKDDVYKDRIEVLKSAKIDSEELKRLYNRKKTKDFLAKISKSNLVKKKYINLASRQLGWLFVRGDKDFQTEVIENFGSYNINPHQFFWVLSNQGLFEDILSTYEMMSDVNKKKHLSMALKAYLYSGQYEKGYELIKSEKILKTYENSKPVYLFYSALILLRLNKDALALDYFEPLIRKETDYKLQAVYIKYNILKALKKSDYKAVAKDLVNLYPLTFYGLLVAHQEQLTNLLPFINSTKLSISDFQFEPKSETRKIKHLAFLFEKGLEGSFRKFIENTVYSLSFESQIVWAYQFKINNEPLSAIKLMNRVWTSRRDLIHPDIIPIAYPKDYLEDVKKNAVSGIDPYLVLGLIRQESAFQKKAKSASSARGLMQLLTGTAREMARSLKMRGVSLPWGLYTPSINIKLGSFYLKKRISAYKGHVPLALASYNVGPGRLSKWSSTRNTITVAQENINADDWKEQDLWVEEMPWDETRFYVKAVLRNFLLYKIFEDYKPLTQCYRLWNCDLKSEIEKTANESSRSFRKY